MDFEKELDELIENNEEPTLEEELSRLGMSFDEAMEAALKDINEHRQLAIKLGVYHSEKPLIWYDLVMQCGVSVTHERLELLVWMLSGKEFTTEEKLCDYEEKAGLVGRWIYCSKVAKELKEQIAIRKQKNNEFSVILDRAKSEKQRESVVYGEEHLRVFHMLCANGYVEDCSDKSILQNNLSCVESCIMAAPWLKPIAPLVYFQVYVCKRKKLLEKIDYIPVIKNLFKPVEYKIDNDNGKNFNTYEEHANLYIDLLDCFSDCDTELCNAGFIKCSNLAEWCYLNVDSGGRIPLNSFALVEQAMPMLFENISEDVPLYKELNLSLWKIDSWKNKYTTITRSAEAAVQELCFDDLPLFVSDSRKMLAEIFGGDFISGIKPAYADIARGILLESMVSRFRTLLVIELAEVLAGYVGE